MSGLGVAVFFAGGGGTAAGHRMAGDRVLYLNELWHAAAETLRLNHPDAIVDERDVREVRGADLPSGVDVIDLSPPCQDFSTAGKRDMNGPNAWLLHEAPRIAAEAGPRALVVENVTGLAKGDARRLHLVPLLDQLAVAGYRADWRVLDASMLGVPQRRERVVVIGIREDLGVDPADAFPRYSARRTVTRDALPDAAAIVRLPRECDRPSNLVYRQPVRWPSGRPAPTMTTGGFSGGQNDSPLGYSRIELVGGGLREVTEEDGKALMGFPPDHAFPDGVPLSARWKMLGNAVPPPMARAWAESLAAALSGARPRTGAA